MHMNSTLLRIFWALLIHAGVLLLAGLLIYFLGQGQDVVAEETRRQYADQPTILEDIRTESVWRLITWCIIALAASWLFASIWLWMAERHRPATPAEGAAKLGSWVLMLITALIAMAVIGWSVIWRNNVQLDVAAGTLTLGMIVVGIATFLGYYLGTAMSVKTTMRPSVPLSGGLPNFSKASS
jgi:uncharacterized membrane protein